MANQQNKSDQPQGDQSANDFTDNENALGDAPNSQPANQTDEQTNGQ